MRLIYAVLLFLCSSALALAQNTPMWIRYPAISPDGKEIVFGYKGDLFKVKTTGGIAQPLTMHGAPHADMES